MKKTWEILKHDGSEPVKCSHCDDGWRHVVGNCVLCGCGPSPWGLDIPQTAQEKIAALATVGISPRAEEIVH